MTTSATSECSSAKQHLCVGWTAGALRLLADGPGHTVVSGPSRRVIRVDVPHKPLRSWVALMDGTRGKHELLGAAPEPAETASKLWDWLVAEGALQPNSYGQMSLARLLPQDLHPERILAHRLVWLGDHPLAQTLVEQCKIVGLLSTFATGEHASAERGAERIVTCIVHDNVQSSEIERIDQELEEQGRLRLHVRVIGDRVFAGPIMAPGFGPTMTDLFRRRRAASQHPLLYELDHGAPPHTPTEAVRPSEWSWVATYLAIQIERWLLGAARAEIASAELELDCVHLTVGHHGILAMPDQRRRRPHRATSVWHLRDPETGVITDVAMTAVPAHFPRRLRIATASGADMRTVMDFRNDLTAFGTSWDDDEAAQGPAIGEFIERYCANWMSPDVENVFGTFAELTSRGLRLVDPRTLVGYSPRQHSLPGFPFAPLDLNAPVTWVRGSGLLSGQDVWVPACWVYVSWDSMKPAAEGRHLYPNLSGIAGGRTLSEATYNALEETVERDASMVWWAHKPILHRIPVMSVAADLVGELGSRFEYGLIPISDAFGLETVAGCIRDTESGFLSIGFATRSQIRAAARKALAESFTLQRTQLTMDSAKPGTAAAAAVQTLRNLKDHREDRRYLDSYRADFRDVKDLACQLQVYLDPRAGAHVASWTVEAPEMKAIDYGAAREKETTTLKELATAISEETGHEPIVVNIVTPDIQEAGFAAVRVLSPGLAPNYPAAFPQYGGGRVASGGVVRGYVDVIPDEGRLNTFPMAHF